MASSVLCAVMEATSSLCSTRSPCSTQEAIRVSSPFLQSALLQSPLFQPTSLQHFTLKYQLPIHDLDSLISLSSDDDFQVFLEEFQRLSASPTPSRIRLFLFPIKQHGLLTTQSELMTTQCGLTHPKTESWFVDALKNAKLMQKGEMGFGGDGQIDVQSGGLGGQESIMLETTSSFGSSSSSVSLSNLPPIKACGDEKASPLQEIATKLPSAESAASEISGVASAISHAPTGTYQDTRMDSKVSFNPFESSDAKITDTVSEVQTNKTVHIPGYPMSSQLDQLQRQQVQFVPMGSHFASQNHTGILPVASCYATYNTPPHQQQLQYLPNQPYPVYVMPVGQTHVYNSLAQYGSKGTLPFVSGRPPLHPNSTLIPTLVTNKDVPPTPSIPEFVSQVYRTNQVANTLVHVPYNENKQNNVAAPHNQLHLIGVTSQETANYGNKHDDDPVRAQIYKSQPPPPTWPPQYQIMTKASTVLLSEALAQLPLDSIKQQVRTSLPQ